MSRYATANCYNCGHEWSFDRRQEERILYKQTEQPGTAREEYLVVCPNCGKQVVVVLTVREEA